MSDEGTLKGTAASPFLDLVSSLGHRAGQIAALMHPEVGHRTVREVYFPRFFVQVGSNVFQSDEDNEDIEVCFSDPGSSEIEIVFDVPLAYLTMSDDQICAERKQAARKAALHQLQQEVQLWRGEIQRSNRSILDQQQRFLPEAEKNLQKALAALESFESTHQEK